jgi:hydroxymethylglutaryl-CoA reductase (NADPH)
MATDSRRVIDFLKDVAARRDPAQLARLMPRHDPPPPKVPAARDCGAEAIERRWSLPGLPVSSRAELADARALEQAERYARNIEGYVGTVKVPVGLAGPLRVNGLFANGDYYVPLATTEAALVASYSRGARLITEAGGCTALLLNEGVQRAPGFAFATLVDAALFVIWATSALDEFKRVVETTTSHGRLVGMNVTLEGNHVYLGFEFTTGDASGQNMVTFATEAVCAFISERAPVRPRYHFVEANLSGDKKATALSFTSVRGKKLSAEVVLPADLVERRLHTTPPVLVDYWRMSALGGVMSGSIGVQGHYANGLAALFIACGQGAACVAESAVGVTRFEVQPGGALYASVTLPNLVVGTVGGGTQLPSQRACLDLMGMAGSDRARAFAEICVAVSLAGELSITGALAAGEFGRAHQLFARGSRK